MFRQAADEVSCKVEASDIDMFIKMYLQTDVPQA